MASGSLTAQVLKREAVMTICTDIKQTAICFRLLQPKQTTNKPARERHGTLADLINQFTSLTSTLKTLSHLCCGHSCFLLCFVLALCMEQLHPTEIYLILSKLLSFKSYMDSSYLFPCRFSLSTNGCNGTLLVSLRTQWK